MAPSGRARPRPIVAPGGMTLPARVTAKSAGVPAATHGVGNVSVTGFDAGNGRARGILFKKVNR